MKSALSPKRPPIANRINSPAIDTNPATSRVSLSKTVTRALVEDSKLDICRN